MNEQEKALLKSKINQAKLISFDIFDTLLFRKTNTPETIFDLTGSHFQIHGFRKLRVDAQHEASRRAYSSYHAPHANMDEIYDVLSEHTEIPVDWNQVKEYEIQMERDALTPNEEMLELFWYTKEQGKRVVATSDMYLFAATLSDFLEEKGFVGFDHIYCSADEHKAKFNKDLFKHVAQQEHVAYKDILHIGDKARDDVEYPGNYGIQTFLYEWGGELEKIKDAAGSDVDTGLYKILYDESKGFWYNLGVEVAGPIYMALYPYLAEKAQGKKIYFLSKGGYNLYHIFKEQGFHNIEYLHTSYRALLLASITEMNAQDIEVLPPYACGQTVGEILDYLRIDRAQIVHLNETGLESFDHVISNEQEVEAFKKLYLYDKDVFLRRCEQERKNAVKYFNRIGFFVEDAMCFDCDWDGSTQDLLERFKQAVGCIKCHTFIYPGIENCDQSRAHLRGLHYDTYLFDHCTNNPLQEYFAENVTMYDLFFSAPHKTVCHYDEDGNPRFEEGENRQEAEQLLAGISDYIHAGLDFVRKYGVEYTPELAIGHLTRLIRKPTETEAIQIGNLRISDEITGREGPCIAWVTQERLESSTKPEIYWLDGLLKRPDISESTKKSCAKMLNKPYPLIESEYHLEDEWSIQSYHRWLNYQAKHKEPERNLTYKPCFSVVIPVYNTVTEQLEECIQSVLAQSYENFELILVDDHSSWTNVVPILRRYEHRSNVRVIYRTTNGHISTATNDGIQAATGDFIVFMDCDDTIEPNALYEFAVKLNENPDLDFIYSDEDKVTEDGKIQHMPFFKPDWSPDLFLNMMYTNHLATYRAAIVKELGGLRSAYNGSQDYDLTLRFVERVGNKRVGHVPKILYHWRERRESVAFAISSKSYALVAARHAKEDYIRRNGLNAHIEPIAGMLQCRIVYEVIDVPLVSIIIPSKDHPDILKQCIESIRAFTNYQNYEIIVVDNGSEAANKAQIEEYLSSIGATYIYEPEPFNFSSMCNCGARHAKGSYLLFLNDDIEVFQPDWMERMLGHAQQKHTGAVGVKLYYPGTAKLQHVGISNPADGPQHSFMAHDDQITCYFGWNRIDSNCIAVTGACLLLATEKFREVGGFDEEYPVAYNDVKLCFSLHEKGYYNVIRNDVAAYHHESLSRGLDLIDPDKLLRLGRERMKLYSEFPQLNGTDPYLNKNLRHWSVGLDLKYSYDELAPLDLSKCRPAPYANVDSMNLENGIQIAGWSFLEGEYHMEDLTRYVVFKDPFGRTYGVRAFAQTRHDVAQHFEQPGYVHSGFGCALKQTDLRTDLFPYELGVLTVTKTGKRYLSWCGKTNMVRHPKPMPAMPEIRQLKSFALHEGRAAVQWSLDECQNYNAYCKLAGFAFKPGGDHYLYRMVLVLSDETNAAFEVDVQPDERLDVTRAFPKEHFLRYTGFVCYLFDGMLQHDREYDVTIRLTNQFDLNDILDIPTGQKVKMG